MKGEHRRNEGGTQQEYPGNIGGRQGGHRRNEGGTKEE